MAGPPTEASRDFTLEDAVHEANRILSGEFGKADQQAVVALALGLFSGRSTAQFMATHLEADRRAWD